MPLDTTTNASRAAAALALMAGLPLSQGALPQAALAQAYFDDRPLGGAISEPGYPGYGYGGPHGYDYGPGYTYGYAAGLGSGHYVHDWGGERSYERIGERNVTLGDPEIISKAAEEYYSEIEERSGGDEYYIGDYSPYYRTDLF